MSQVQGSSTSPALFIAAALGILGIVGGVIWTQMPSEATPEGPSDSFVAADVAAPAKKTSLAQPKRKGAISRDAARETAAKGAAPATTPGAKQPPIDAEGLKKALANSKLQPAPAANMANRAAGRAAIKDAVSQIKPELKDCYESLLGDFPDAAGKIKVSMKLEAKGRQGKVQEVRIGDGTTLFDERMLACVKDSAAQVSFPFDRDDGIINVTYPFTFRND